MEKIIYTKKIDFDELEAWRDPERDDIPVTSFIALYKALGFIEQIQAYQKENPDFVAVPADNIACNLSTFRRLKKFLEDIWATYSLDIKGDNEVVWDTKKWPKGKKHYAKRLRKIVQASLGQDLVLYCPAIDDELNVNEICFRIILPDPEDGAEQEA